MTALRAMDDFLIDSVFQRIADFVHGWTGWDSILQSRLITGLQGMFWAAVAGLDLANRDPAAPDFFFALLVLTLATFPCRSAEVARRAARNGMRNPHRLKRFDFVVRILLLTISPFSLFAGSWQYVGLFCSVFLSSYMECCDVQQPRNHRLREWVRSLMPALRSVGTPATLPTPSG